MFQGIMILPCLAAVLPLLAEPPTKTEPPAAVQNLNAVLEPIRQKYELPALSASGGPGTKNR